MAHDHDQDVHNTSANEHFEQVLERSLADPSRRRLIRGGFGLAALSAVSALPGCASVLSPNALPKTTALGFASLDKSLLDQVMLPAGYSMRVLHASGDPLTAATPAYSNQGLETDDWSTRVGDQHDGMDLYYLDSAGKYANRDTGRAVLAVNHESSAEAHLLHPHGQTSNGVSGRKFSQFGDWDLGSRPALVRRSGRPHWPRKKVRAHAGLAHRFRQR